MTRPTQLILLFAAAFGALMLGASFGTAQQAPATAAPPTSANAPSAPGSGPSPPAATPAPTGAPPSPAHVPPAPAAAPSAPSTAAPVPANVQPTPAPASAAAQPAPAHAPPAPVATPAPRNAQPAPGPAATAITLSPADLAFLDRVTWGANESTAAEFVALGRDRWLDRQLHPGPKDRLPAAAQAIINALPIASRPLTEIAWPLTAQQRNLNQIPDPDQKKTLQQAFQQSLNELGRQAATRSLLRDLYSPDQLREKMTWFWFNHFNVHLYKSDIRETIGDYEEQLHHNALGHFRDLLRATATHPAMLRYLDNAENAKGHINENYAREIMELHTMGVGSGYTQEDVQELARILTGVGVNFQPPDPNAPKPQQQPGHIRSGLFEFNPARHDYGVKHFLGHTIEGRGFAEVEQALDILARHPATATYVSRKIATYFMSDTPPDALVQRMAQSFRSTDGDIISLLLVMFKSPEFTGSLNAKTKYKDPMRFVLSAVRLAYDTKVILNAGPIIGWLNRLAEGLYNHPTPDGYPVTAAAWNSPGQMATRFEIARAIGSNGGGMFKAPPPDTAERPGFPQIASAFYFNAVQPTLSQATRSALDQAGSPQEWNALFLSSPEFMR